MRKKQLLVVLFCLLMVTIGLRADKKTPWKGSDWMPKNPEIINNYMHMVKEEIKKEKNVSKISDAITTLSPLLKEFKHLIYSDPIIHMYFTLMIDQVPQYYIEKYPKMCLKSIDEMLVLIDHIITKAPKFNKTDLVGFPINAILNWTMGVPAGFSVYRNDKLNKMFQKILNKWKQFLDSPDSLSVLNPKPGGWQCKAAIEALKMWEFQYDKHAPHWGFKSWNKFFIRQFKKGMRPVTEPKNNKVIVSACESQVFQIANNVKLEDWYWVKEQPYSLIDMLAEEKKKHKKVSGKDHFKTYVKPFIGGTIFQAFLSAKSYHRWHSPVSGTVKKAYIIPGSYYSEAESEGMDPGGPNLSQGYIAHTAARAIIYIEADDPVIGLMAVMPIGMAEVSSCFIHPKFKKPNARVTKGEELGYFQYGGSSHCLIFRPGAIKEFKSKDSKKIEVNEYVKVREQIAIAN